MRRILVMLQALGVISCMSGVGAFGGPMLEASGQQDEIVPCVQVSELFEIAAAARLLRSGLPAGASVFGGAYRWVEDGAGTELCVLTSIAYFDCFVNEELSVVLD